jgi:hypothetical protein
MHHVLFCTVVFYTIYCEFRRMPLTEWIFCSVEKCKYLLTCSLQDRDRINNMNVMGSAPILASNFYTMTFGPLSYRYKRGEICRGRKCSFVIDQLSIVTVLCKKFLPNDLSQTKLHTCRLCLDHFSREEGETPIQAK